MSNIYRITNENDIVEIVEHNLYKLTVVSFTTKQYKHNEFKKCLNDLASKFRNSIFLYVDVNNYLSNGNLRIYNIPETIIVYNGKRCVQIDGINFDLIVDKFCEFEMKTRHITLKYISELNAYKHMVNGGTDDIKINIPENINHSEKMENKHAKNAKNIGNPKSKKMSNKVKKNDNVTIKNGGKKKVTDTNKWDVNDVIKKLEMVKKTKEAEEKILGLS